MRQVKRELLKQRLSFGVDRGKRAGATQHLCCIPHLKTFSVKHVKVVKVQKSISLVSSDKKTLDYLCEQREFLHFQFLFFISAFFLVNCRPHTFNFSLEILYFESDA
jgi:hypothetical protein